MKKHHFRPAFLAAALAETSPPVVSDAEKAAMESYQCPEWFRDAKFGIWSHWGPDSVPGIFNNYAHDLYTQGSPEYEWHLEHYGHPSEFGYKDVINSWKAEKFDPDALVAKYKAAGANGAVLSPISGENDGRKPAGPVE